MYFQINNVKYNADQKIKNAYENLEIVWSHWKVNIHLNSV